MYENVLQRNGGNSMENKDIKVDQDTYNLIRVRTTELTVRSGKLMTIKRYVKNLVEQDLTKSRMEENDE